MSGCTGAQQFHDAANGNQVALVFSWAVKAQIEQRFSLEQAREAHEHVASGRKVGNIVFVMESSG